MARAVFQATIADFAGNIQPGAQVYIRDQDTMALASPVMSARTGGTNIGNPFPADDQGFARGYVPAPGRYHIRAVFGGSVREWENVVLHDDASAIPVTILGDFLYNSDGTGLAATNFAALVRQFANVPTLRGASFSGYNQPIQVPVNDVSVPVAFDASITKVIVLTQGGTGSCSLDVWKRAYSSYPPTSGQSITGGNKPAITSGIKYQDSTLTGWTTNVSAGDVLTFHLETNSLFTNIAIFVVLTPVGAQDSADMDDDRVREIVQEVLEEGGAITVVGNTYTVNLQGVSGPINLWALLGRPSGAVVVNCGTPSGGIVSETVGVAGLDLRGFATGSVIHITAQGIVQGHPGEGGDGCSISNTFGEDGGSGRRGVSGHGARRGRAGGPAIIGPGTGITFTLSAAAGYIFGGGGGGGGGGGTLNFAGDTNCAAGGGGGAGAGGARGGREGVAVAASSTLPAQATAQPGGDSTGGVTGAAGAGGTGAANGSGDGGDGGAGGDWGAGGTVGESPTGNDRDYAGGAAGAGGKAIDLNGGTVTITDGNDSTHIKGAVA
jgi:hypothetical protein